MGACVLGSSVITRSYALRRGFPRMCLGGNRRSEASIAVICLQDKCFQAIFQARLQASLLECFGGPVLLQVPVTQFYVSYANLLNLPPFRLYCIASTTRLTESSACVVVLWCHEIKDHRKQSLNERKEKRKGGEQNKYNLQKILTLLQTIPPDFAFGIKAKIYIVFLCITMIANVCEARSRQPCFEFE